jgi:uncharacterized membrane protein YedE/YeeE
MNLPITGENARWLAIPFGMLFGLLLHRGGVTTYNVIVNQFRLKDFTVLKVMLTAVVVGAIGVLALHYAGHAQYHIKPANLLGVALGAAIFGVGMVLYGYCPGTGIAAVANGSIHALVGLLGMLAGGIAYALSFTWIESHIQNVGAFGKIRFSDITGIPEWGWWLILVTFAAAVFRLIEAKKTRMETAAGEKRA